MKLCTVLIYTLEYFLLLVQHQSKSNNRSKFSYALSRGFPMKKKNRQTGECYTRFSLNNFKILEIKLVLFISADFKNAKLITCYIIYILVSFRGGRLVKV